MRMRHAVVLAGSDLTEPSDHVGTNLQYVAKKWRARLKVVILCIAMASSSRK
jgi:hypothetical protein